jgi:hypothetical protein
MWSFVSLFRKQGLGIGGWGLGLKIRKPPFSCVTGFAAGHERLF